MPCERGMNGDLGRFPVANFADHDDVGILPENRSQPGGKRQVDLGIHLHLADAEQLIFHRIFDGNDVLVRRIDLRSTPHRASWFCRFLSDR